MISEPFNKHKKQLIILTTAKSLFWKYGFKRVSIEEICREAKTSKVTFYRFFPNKLEVAKAVFDQAADEGITKFKTILEEATTASALLSQMLQLKMEGVYDISQEFLNDFYSNPELGLKAHIEEKTKLAWNDLLNDFKAAQQRGLFRKDMKVEFLLHFTQHFATFLNDPYLQALYGKPEELVMEFAKFTAYGISPHDE